MFFFIEKSLNLLNISFRQRVQKRILSGRKYLSTLFWWAKKGVKICDVFFFVTIKPHSVHNKVDEIYLRYILIIEAHIYLPRFVCEHTRATFIAFLWTVFWWDSNIFFFYLKFIYQKIWSIQRIYISVKRNTIRTVSLSIIIFE